jgi:hypothetical protein
MKKLIPSVFVSLVCLLPLGGAWAGTVSGAAAPLADPAIAGSETPRPCMCLGAHAGPGAGAAEAVSFNVSLGYDSSYFCRGLDAGDDVFSGNVTVDVTVAPNLVWTMTERYLYVDETEFEENQLYTGLFYNVGALSFGLSVRWYHNEQGAPFRDYYDLGFQALVKLGLVNLYGGYYYETESEGHFFEVGAAATFKLSERLSLVPAAEVSYTDGWLAGPGVQGWNIVNLRLSMPVKLTENFSFVPYVGAALPLEALKDMQDNRFIWGASLSATF